MAKTEAAKTEDARLDRYHGTSMQTIKLAGKAQCLKRIQEAVGFVPKFDRAPWPHQLQLLAATLETNAMLIAAAAGSGKTYAALISWSVQRKANRPVGDLLIVVPNSSVAASWVNEAANIKQKVINLTATGQKKLTQINARTHIYTITYSALSYLLKKTGMKRYSADQDVADQLMQKVGMVVFDECHMAKNTAANTYRACAAIRARCNMSLSMSATPVRKLIDLYGVARIIDGGAALGQTKSAFLARWFNVWHTPWGAVEYKPKKGAETDIKNRLDTMQVSFGIDELETSLPELVRNTVEFDRTKEYSAARTRILNGMIDVNGATYLLQNKAPALFAVGSGYKYGTDPDTFEKDTELFKENPKVDWLINLLTELDDTEQVVVFTELILTDYVIKEALKKAKIKKVQLYRDGSGATNYKNFIAGKTRVLIGNSKAIGTGLNLQSGGCRHAVNFEHSWSSTTVIQRDKRLHRGGAKRTVFIHDLVIKNGIEGAVIKAASEGKELNDRMLDSLART